MERKRTTVILVAAAVAILAIIGGTIFACTITSRPTYSRLIHNGDRYYRAGKYDKAIIEYEAAVRENEYDERGYVGLYNVYHEMEYDALAFETLQTAFQKTASDNIRSKLEIYYPNEFHPERATSEQTVLPEKTTSADKGGEYIAMNTELLRFISSASYSDYERRYAALSDTVSNGRYCIRPQGLALDLLYYDTATKVVINSATGKPNPEMLPNEIIMDNICLLFGNLSEITGARLRMIPGVTDLVFGENTVEFTAEGCRITAACDEEGTIHENAENSIIPLNQSAAEQHHLIGHVIDAATGKPVSGASVIFYAGYGAFGSGIEAHTGSFGEYDVYVDKSGTFSVTVSKQGYITESFEIFVTQAGSELTNDFTISPELSGEQMRIVLTWGAMPVDLDSYLRGTTDSGEHVYVDFAQMISRSGNRVIASLDVDDMSGYGPETITIQDTNGVYEFSVVDYTMTGTMASSGVTVKVYRGNSLIQTFDGACEGNGWKVCRIDHGQISVLNSSCNVIGGRLAE